MRRARLAQILVLAGLAVLTPRTGVAAQWGATYLPNDPVITQNGRVVRFYDDLIRNKIVVVNFIYTSCKDVCPLASARMAQLQDALGDRVGRDIFLYSISIDPEHDTPHQLKQYAEAFHAGPGWLFLTGAPEDIKQIRWKLGERSRALWEHRNDIMLGNGSTGEWQRDSMLADVDRLIEVIRQMDPNWRNKAHQLPTALTTANGSRAGAGSTATATSPYRSRVVNADTKFIVANRPGEALFAKACAVCHTIGEGGKVGPDLNGLTARRSRSWIIDLITNPDKLRARNDPIILSLMANFPTVRMPFLQINEADAADLIAYIDARSTRRAPTIALEPLCALTTQDGSHLAPTDLEGRPFAVVFGYTHCPDVCPTTLLQWTNLLRSAGVAANEFRLLFVSVDSERDTPAVLKSYLASFDSRIIALTGSPSQIAKVAQQFGAHYAKVAGEDGNYTYDHTVQRYLIGRDSRLAGITDLRTAEAEQRKMFARLVTDDHLKGVRR